MGTPGRCGRAGVCPSGPMKPRPGLGGAMPRQPESGDGIDAPLSPVGAGIPPGALGPAVSGHFSDPAADAAFIDADGGLWLRRSGEDAVLAGIMFTPAEVGLMVDAI